jgi:hypothetical protein
MKNDDICKLSDISDAIRGFADEKRRGGNQIDDSCNGCLELIPVRPIFGVSMSSPGYACAVSGGHAIKRCSKYHTSKDKESK